MGLIKINSAAIKDTPLVYLRQAFNQPNGDEASVRIPVIAQVASLELCQDYPSYHSYRARRRYAGQLYLKNIQLPHGPVITPEGELLKLNYGTQFKQLGVLLPNDKLLLTLRVKISNMYLFTTTPNKMMAFEMTLPKDVIAIQQQCRLPLPATPHNRAIFVGYLIMLFQTAKLIFTDNSDTLFSSDFEDFPRRQEFYQQLWNDWVDEMGLKTLFADELERLKKGLK